MSVAIWSATKEQWVNGVAVMDPGCEGGHFVDSAFLADHLGMAKLKSYGWEIESGCKGRKDRALHSWST
jgi:hypothetical protein